MYQIDNEKFGQFITEARKEKNLTQKELGDRLFVSDKTVSKWERGQSIPNVMLLMPLAEVLGITVTELLRGERIMEEQRLETSEVEGLVTGSLDLSLKNSVKRKKRNWVFAFFICLIVAIAETYLLKAVGMSYTDMLSDVFLVSGLNLLFGGWFCFCAKEILPTYYDENRINAYSQGIFRINMPGVAFNNGNWPYICKTMKIWTLTTSVIYPLLSFCLWHFGGFDLWISAKMIFVFVFTLGMMVPLYIVGIKYA